MRKIELLRLDEPPALPSIRTERGKLNTELTGTIDKDMFTVCQETKQPEIFYIETIAGCDNQFYLQATVHPYDDEIPWRPVISFQVVREGVIDTASDKVVAELQFTASNSYTNHLNLNHRSVTSESFIAGRDLLKKSEALLKKLADNSIISQRKVGVDVGQKSVCEWFRDTKHGYRFYDPTDAIRFAKAIAPDSEYTLRGPDSPHPDGLYQEYIIHKDVIAKAEAAGIVIDKDFLKDHSERFLLEKDLSEH